MPVYDFKCSKCDISFEKDLKMGFKDMPKCPKCESSKDVTKLISAPSGIIFKGSGFYKTDSRAEEKCSKCEKKKVCQKSKAKK